MNDARSERQTQPKGEHLRLSPLLRAYFERRQDLVRVFAARLRSLEAAEDLVQDMYVRLTQREPEGLTVEQPSAYLFRLGSNLMVDHVRTDSRRRRRDDDWSREAWSPSAHPAAPEAAAVSRDELQRLLQAVAKLKPRTREVFRLHKLEGLSHADVASRLGISKSAVEKHMAIALQQALGVLR
ncbi:MAG: polymerase subunit sigma-24 [Caulobacteraceae bacterium]|nr:polymerase subunit sigma-24 [Caulobacteraceae bacterium]